MLDKPASTLLHLGPGLANGLANLHNAKKANSGIVNIVGEHATYHIAHDAPLTSDIEGVARPMSHWVKTSPNSTTIASDGALAIQAARQTPGQIATLILPADTAWGKAAGIAETPPATKPAKVSPEAVKADFFINFDSNHRHLSADSKNGLMLGMTTKLNSEDFN